MRVSIARFGVAGLFALEGKVSTEKMNQKPRFRIFVAGGSLFAKEAGIHSSCEILRFTPEGDICSTPFASLNVARRGASCCLFSTGKNARIWVIGGCTENESTTQHLDSVEYYDFVESPAFDSKAEGSWRTLRNFLNIGRSCFMTAAVCDVSANKATSDRLLFVLGGWNGVRCLSDVEYVRFKADVSTNSSPVPQILTSSSSEGGTTGNSTILTTTGTDAIVESVSLADSISPVKNGCCVLSADDEQRNVSLLLVGGWDGRRTLNTIFRRTFPVSTHFLDDSKEQSLVRLLPYAVECHAAVTQSNGVLYLVGGFDGLRVVDTIIRVDSKNETAIVLPTKLSVARECHCAEIVVGDRSDGGTESFLVVVGGWDGFEALRSVEIFRIIDQDPYLLPLAMKHDALLHARNRACSVVLPGV